MRALSGVSKQVDARAAVREATGGWDAEPEMLFVFCSSKQDAEAVAEALAERYPDVPMAGCSTAGEHLDGVHHRDCVVLTGLCDSGTDWVVRSVDGLGTFDDARAEALAGEMFEAHGVDVESLEPSEFVALLFVDGLSLAEERVSAALASGLGGVALAGGSAGDDLAFEGTFVIGNGSAAPDRATVVLARGRQTKFEVLKHQHFTTHGEMLAVTRADPATRRVYELDGYPAVEAYARALGTRREDFDPSESFLHPVTFRCDGELYVRSIQSVNEDGSLTFYCAIEEGMVLQVGDHHDMREALERDLAALGGGEGKRGADFVLLFNCVLRALEATDGNRWDELGAAVTAKTAASVGFDTYGEQLNGLHINQTLVAVAFSSSSEAEVAA